MTDDLQEGALPADESQELVAPELLEEDAEVQQPSVTEAGITEARLIEVLTERDEKQARKAQSAKDRAISAQGKTIETILGRLDELDGDRGALLREADQLGAVEATQAWQAGIESRLSDLAVATTKQTWKQEWTEDSQKILDAAAKKGTVLSTEEVNAAFFGQKFASRGDAIVYLNELIDAKKEGAPAPVPAAAVLPEGGEVARTPEPVVPQTYRQQFDKAKTEGDTAKMQELIDENWEEQEQFTRAQAAKQTLSDLGMTAEELAALE